MLAHLTIITSALASACALPQLGHAVSSLSLDQGSYRGGQVDAHVRNYVAAFGQQGENHRAEYYAHPKYEFLYAVEDKHTGDVKSHHEERDGDNTRGYYTVNEPDGTVLTVHYSVDKDSGFRAVVERTGHATHPRPVKKVAVVAPTVHHAPVLRLASNVNYAPRRHLS